MAAVGPAVRPGDTRRRPNALSEVLAEVDARKGAGVLVGCPYEECTPWRHLIVHDVFIAVIESSLSKRSCLAVPWASLCVCLCACVFPATGGACANSLSLAVYVDLHDLGRNGLDHVCVCLPCSWPLLPSALSLRLQPCCFCL